MFSAALYARVRFLLVHFAHEIAGAARIRHSLLPHRGGNDRQTSGKPCREIADVYLVFFKQAHRHPEVLATSASLEG